MNLKEACDKIGISKSTYLRYEDNKILPKAKRDGRGWRIFTKINVNTYRKILKREKLI